MVAMIALFSTGAALADVPKAAAPSAGIAAPASAPKIRTYILNGYSFTGVHGVNAAEMEAKLKHHEGARITRADAAADGALLAKELKARHIPGQLFTTLAENNGRVWVIFDLLNTDDDSSVGNLKSQDFNGVSHVSAISLAAATGLKKGDKLTRQKLIAARRAIVLAYAKSMPGKKISLKAKLQRKLGEVTLTWIIGEPK
jgi:outer membrane protein assembly factor BamA